ncbi:MULTISPECIES: carboxylating nicotinate-nucleotide diphosphorylase [Bacillaceae]|uniref:Probable nicotinate-nucleotide pyrophosphorylase [carboxylating] n=1 Tax=Domibacillus aminovorans TaxID=29332 RepID=A0A177KSK1_9BACI|nr:MULTISPECIES: carboxylating nicotinate-nucleotide diphosphorylase [Bacillaceae]OAH56127.1 nicotinate-nucleotide pyrophosphorylase [Domibacillus aminovorans]
MNGIKLDQLLTAFFIEDIGDRDVSGESIFSEEEMGSFTFTAKEAGIFCGRAIIERGFRLVDEHVTVSVLKKDGDVVRQGEVIARIQGSLRALLSGERVILNLVQRMSGIATAAAQAVKETEGTNARVCDTRKTVPGLRMIEKYAVRTGGAFNHRTGLYDAVMLKDNHIAFAGSISSAVEKARSACGHTMKIEVEIETKEQLIEAVEAGADIVMFDNCTPEQIKSWLPIVPAHIATEASGGITIENIRDYALTGVGWISLGALTHSVKALDISARVDMKGAVLNGIK